MPNFLEILFYTGLTWKLVSIIPPQCPCVSLLVVCQGWQVYTPWCWNILPEGVVVCFQTNCTTLLSQWIALQSIFQTISSSLEIIVHILQQWWCTKRVSWLPRKHPIWNFWGKQPLANLYNNQNKYILVLISLIILGWSYCPTEHLSLVSQFWCLFHMGIAPLYTWPQLPDCCT